MTRVTAQAVGRERRTGILPTTSRWHVLPALATIALGAAACEAREATQLDVRVVDGTGGALDVPNDLDAFEIRVASVYASGREQVRFVRTVRLASGTGAGSGVSLPQTLAIVPSKSDTGDLVSVTVRGLRRGVEVQRIVRARPFGIGRVELAPFELTPACFGVTCPLGQNCDPRTRACVPDLPDCGEHGCVDAGVAPDAGPCGSSTTALFCDGLCVPSDTTNCGACGNACATEERCVSGTCLCRAGLERCGGTCLDLSNDPVNCGACGVSCALPNASTACSGWSCSLLGCEPGYLDCNATSGDGCEQRDDCMPSSPCTTSCGSTGTRGCSDRCSPTCVPPAETCNAIDDDCNARCDDLTGCRVGVIRFYRPAGGGEHFFSTVAADGAGFSVEAEAYFFIYAAPGGSLVPLYRCRRGTKTALALDAACEGNGTVERLLGYLSRDGSCGAQPLYEIHRPDTGDYFYALTLTERDNALVMYGYVADRTIGYFWPGPSG